MLLALFCTPLLERGLRRLSIESRYLYHPSCNRYVRFKFATFRVRKREAAWAGATVESVAWFALVDGILCLGSLPPRKWWSFPALYRLVMSIALQNLNVSELFQILALLIGLAAPAGYGITSLVGEQKDHKFHSSFVVLVDYEGHVDPIISTLGCYMP